MKKIPLSHLGSIVALSLALFGCASATETGAAGGAGGGALIGGILGGWPGALIGGAAGAAVGAGTGAVVDANEEDSQSHKGKTDSF